MNVPRSNEDYLAFLRAKVAVAASLGFEVDDSEINPILKPHQRAIVRWAIAGGRRAIFAAFGLGKSVIQIEIVRIVMTRVGGLGLIVIPLGVRQEFIRDAAMLGVAVQFIRTTAEATDPAVLYLTNYESVRDGKLDPRVFVVASLDEAAVLRGFGGTKTFREFMRLFAGDDRSTGIKSEGVRFRFVATAVPSPNEYIELLAYSAYLEVMEVGQAKTRFFKRNSEKADQLTIHGHKEQEFWLWVATWALFVQKPSDINASFSDEGYELPPIEICWHELASDHLTAAAEKDGQGRLFRSAALGVIEASKEKRDSVGVRVAKLVELISGREGTQHEEATDRGLQGLSAGVPAGVLPPHEGRARCASEEPGAEGIHGPVPTEEPRGASANIEAEGVWPDAAATRRASGAPGVAVSDLSAIPGVPGDSIDRSLARDRGRPRCPVQEVQCSAGSPRGEHGQPGAGDRVSEHPSSAGDSQVVVWCDLNDEQVAIERALKAEGIAYSSLTGSQLIEQREELMLQWKSRQTRAFVSKPSMYGAGANLQQAHTMIFAGITFKANEVIQAVHRIHRFLQKHPCTVHFIYTEAEREVRAQLERKWIQHNTMVEKMTQIIREFGLAHAAAASQLARALGVERVEASGEKYSVVNNDTVIETRSMGANSVDLIVTSIPFANQYEYTPSYNDFGHTDSNAHFWAQMDFLTPELLRVLKPGRVCAIHVKDRITPGGINGLGFQTVTPVSDECVAHFIRHGFALLARKTIVTDVVRENNQNYRLGWSEQCKDGSRMGAGMPEYMLIFRKPPSDPTNGYADLPVTKDKSVYTRPRWQFDAHGFARSSGNRPLTPEELEGLDQSAIFKLFRQHSLENVYDFRHDVKIAEAVDRTGWLPSTFMLLQPQSWHPDVWTDITRMRTLNGAQSSTGREMHICPLQFDIVDRCIEQYSMPGEVVYDPFGGLMTVPYCAIKLGRYGRATELNKRYWMDGAAYCAAASIDQSMPDLFDLLTQVAA
jgi:DNA modification methylase